MAGASDLESLWSRFPGLVRESEHDRRLLAEVHPPDWANPEPAERYHLVVIGGGTAGLVTAAVGAALGARVALVERALMGGDCLNVGCVPSKAVLEEARTWHEGHRGTDPGAAGAAAGAAAAHEAFGDAMERMRAVRARISGHDSAARFRDLGVDVFIGEGRFVDGTSVSVGDRRLKFLKAVIATGTHPAIPPIPGLAEAGYRTNETIFSLTSLPPRLAVIGAGAIGCELAQAFARFGADVTILEAGPRILPNDDPEAAAVVENALRREGIEILLSARIAGVGTENGERVISAETAGGPRRIAAEEVLVATGRAPNVKGIGLEQAGVEFGDRGITTDFRLRTTNSRIYAIGDVVARHRFTHVADAHARMVVRNALFFGRGSVEDLVIPWCTYTTPELAHVGLTPAQLTERGQSADTVTVSFADVDRARLDGHDEGFLRVHLEPGSDRILGATLVGEGAADILATLTVAMTNGLGLAKLADTIFPYPTRGEIVRKAADQWRRGKLTPAAKQLFQGFFRIR